MHDCSYGKYEYCISLGWFCGTASAMSRLGLRSCSGPFDWYFSDFWAVVEQIETDFENFMCKDYLEIVDGNTKIFRDVKYGFYCNHDVKIDFEKEYAVIYERYMRRVKKFREMILQPTLFFRCVKDKEEVAYINQNWEKIDCVLRSFNGNNQIIYIGSEEIGGLTDKVQYFPLHFKRYIGEMYEMRHMFDENKELLVLCDSLLDTDTVQKNKEFDTYVNAEKVVKAYIKKSIEEGTDVLKLSIQEMFNSTLEEGIYIWGAGQYGMAIAKYLREQTIPVRAIIDNNLRGVEREGFVIQSPKYLTDGAKIFIAVASPEGNHEIERQIRNMNLKTTVMKFYDLHEN